MSKIFVFFVFLELLSIGISMRLTKDSERTTFSDFSDDDDSDDDSSDESPENGDYIYIRWNDGNERTTTQSNMNRYLGREKRQIPVQVHMSVPHDSPTTTHSSKTTASDSNEEINFPARIAVH